MAEWSIAPVLKTGVPRGTGGSNPSFSAEDLQQRKSFFYALKFCKPVQILRDENPGVRAVALAETSEATPSFSAEDLQQRKSFFVP